uniref:Nucleolar GTP-binding protein 2 N-terminal domain-containing protein n=1 Tax=Glossina morsitans morsitans TaxID=37546 RepID=A0A1B0G2C0_GLOMM
MPKEFYGSTRKQGFNKSNHLMNPERPKSKLKGLLIPERRAQLNVCRCEEISKPNAIRKDNASTVSEEIGTVIRNPYQVIMKRSQLPITLLNEASRHQSVHLLDTESFDNVFGAKKQRKRVNLKFKDLEDLT